MNEMQELIQEILTGMQRRYRGMSEIERLTKELADTLSSGDRESAQLLLNMRQSEMEKVGDVGSMRFGKCSMFWNLRNESISQDL